MCLASQERSEGEFASDKLKHLLIKYAQVNEIF
jgi:hypothetical protein